MRYVTLTLLLIFALSYHLHAQVQIEGRVVDNATGEPLAGASVYLNHTTIGTTTRADGYFSLPAIAAGNYELVVSYVGFERILYDLQVKSRGIRLLFRMDAKAANTKDILILAPKLRKKWMDIFRRQFLGDSPEADATTIVNEDDVIFFDTGDKDLIGAYSDVPLVVENRALGYRIYFELIAFSYHLTTYKISFFGYNRYEELDEKDNDSDGYALSRQLVYQGSTTHFFRSLKSDRVREEGFSMQTVKQANDESSSRKKVEPTNASSGPEIFTPGKWVAASRSTIVAFDSSRQQQYLLWEGGLEVSYSTPSELPSRLSRTGAVFGDGGKLVSYMFIEKGPVDILDDGMPIDPRMIRFGGWWSKERVANMLPQDYNPESKSVLEKKGF